MPRQPMRRDPELPQGLCVYGGKILVDYKDCMMLSVSIGIYPELSQGLYDAECVYRDMSGTITRIV